MVHGYYWPLLSQNSLIGLMGFGMNANFMRMNSDLEVKVLCFKSISGSTKSFEGPLSSESIHETWKRRETLAKGIERTLLLYRETFD